MARVGILEVHPTVGFGSHDHREHHEAVHLLGLLVHLVVDVVPDAEVSPEGLLAGQRASDEKQLQVGPALRVS